MALVPGVLTALTLAMFGAPDPERMTPAAREAAFVARGERVLRLFLRSRAEAEGIDQRHTALIAESNRLGSLPPQQRMKRAGELRAELEHLVEQQRRLSGYNALIDYDIERTRRLLPLR